MKLKINAVVTAYNRGAKIQETVNSLIKQNIPLQKIIVVDNSTDEKKKVHLKDKSEKIEIVSLDKNLGPGWARNIGLTKSLNADFVVFLDDDITFEKDTVFSLLKAFEKNKDCVGAMPVVYFKEKKNKVWCAGGGVNLITGQTFFNTKRPNKEYSEVASAASVLMVKPNDVRKSGWYDPVYFFSYEDADFYFRLRIKIRGKIYVVKSAGACHDVPVLDTKSFFRLALRSYYIGRGRVIFLSRFGKNFVLNLFFIVSFSLYYFYLGMKLGFPLSGVRFIEGIIDGLKVVYRGNKTSEETGVRTKIDIEKITRPAFLKDYIITTW